MSKSELLFKNNYYFEEEVSIAASTGSRCGETGDNEYMDPADIVEVPQQSHSNTQPERTMPGYQSSINKLYENSMTCSQVCSSRKDANKYLYIQSTSEFIVLF